MAENASMFDAYLKEQNIALEKKENDDGIVYVVRELLPDVGPVAVVLLFNPSDRLVTVIAYQYLKIADPAKTRDVIELINVLNAEYTMVKFTAAADFVTVQVALPFNGNFTSEVIVEMVSVLLQAIREEHPRFMALM
ncbi:MAG TPA: YbjN domain-containing protein [Geobacteraceae bacterium]|nr:YbjN domain-containing protein [Geobacteraceae bacterium]